MDHCCFWFPKLTFRVAASAAAAAADRVHVLGSTLWRNRALEARGYEVVTVTAWDWDAAAAKGMDACQRLLLDRLGLL